MPHLYAHAEAAKKTPILTSASYHLRLGYDFEAKKDLVKRKQLARSADVGTVLGDLPRVVSDWACGPAQVL